MNELELKNNKIIDGVEIADKIKHSVRREIIERDLIPGLAIILVGKDSASHLYVSKKEKACAEVGIVFNKYLFKERDNEQNIIDTINFLNNDEEVDAIIVQLPLPKKFDTQKIINSINPKKDVDGFHPENINKFINNETFIEPVMTKTIKEVLNYTNEKLKGKYAVILGNSHEFIKPIEKMLSNLEIKTSHTHTSENNWQEKTKTADILITAVGEAFLIKKEMIKDDVVIIDVGINKVGNTTVGDVDYTDVFPKCKFITPVPGGIGPITIAYLLKNTLELHKKFISNQAHK
ncbi:MAG: tetrahydrofolate dehydrogenase/cyclohydrolase catalytic domain-containing protein [Patescibacteria group bacterium]|nr:tetrahydrofolate dehydrogenase/cyclohydrolase catalytic domain-containing protein [Patescibacteria group bacterium]MDD4304744.1 tetrahydrofolate dehydrogenase/cyclohydrolase catalytic domain-containing protein [Patescibacteria group bacterium]MDD4695501.1 tetrahydrofolate dehydrogenase/cyclohydrolase catalytic domain-containing protein [Patescibacteria group bacterium]